MGTTDTKSGGRLERAGEATGDQPVSASAVSAAGGSLRRKVSGYKARLEEVFTAVAQGLPQLHGDLRQQASLLEQLDSSTSTDSFGRRLGSLAELTGGLEALVGQLVADQGRILTRAEQSVAITEELASNLGQVALLAARTRLLALNATATAAASGEAGRSFAVLTEELIDVAPVALALAREAGSSATEIRQRMDEVLSLGTALQARRAQLDGAMQRSIAQAVDAVRATVRAAEPALGASLKASTSAGEPIARLMLAIQREDIQRQELEHVEQILVEVERAAAARRQADEQGSPPPASLQAFAGRALSLAARLVRSTEEAQAQLLGELASLLHALREAAVSLATLPKELREPKALASKMQEPAHLLEEAIDRLGEDTGTLGTYARACSRLDALVARLPSRIAQLEEIVSHLGVVHVMIRIELARSDALSAAEALADDLRDICNDFNALVRGLQQQSTALARSLTGLHAEVTTTSRSLVRGLETHGDRVLDEVDGLVATVDEFQQRLQQVAGLGESMTTTVVDFEAQVQRLGGGQKAGTGLSGLLDAAARAASRSAPANAAEPGETTDPSPWDDRLGALAQRFTTRAHREIAAQPGEHDTDVDDEAGALTLF